MRIAAVPASHPYVTAIAAEWRNGVALVPDPPVPGAPPGQWWPPVKLTAAWLAAADYDLVHVHFGYEHLDPAEMHACLDVIERRAKTLVVTVHDLANPHHRDQSQHRALQTQLLSRASAVLTLTDHAAAEIRRRHGRRATVVPHPAVVPVELIDGYRRRRHRPDTGDPLRLGVALKSFRANVHGVQTTEALLDLVAEGCQVWPTFLISPRVWVHPTGAEAVETIRSLRTAVRDHRCEVVLADRLSDPALFEFLLNQDAHLLPYGWGTHSGWLEAAHDVGAYVLAPRSGGYSDQGAAATFAWGEELRPTLRAALSRVRALVDIGPAGVDAATRFAQLRLVAEAHVALYAAATSLSTRGGPGLGRAPQDPHASLPGDTDEAGGAGEAGDTGHAGEAGVAGHLDSPGDARHPSGARPARHARHAGDAGEAGDVAVSGDRVVAGRR